MIAKRNPAVPAAILLICVAGVAWAQSGLTPPAGQAAGWWVDVGPAAADLGAPPATRLGSFAAPAAGFDLGTYRDAVQQRIASGVAYDARGALQVATAGPHRIAVTGTWRADEGADPAHCLAALTVEGRPVASWRADVGQGAGQQEADGIADLQPGLRAAELRLACDRPLGARLNLTLTIKGPADGGLRPIGPVEIVHAVTGAAAQAAIASASPPSTPAAGQPTAPAGRAMVSTIDLTIRDRPDNAARSLGRVSAGQAVTVTGAPGGSGWVQLAEGGFVDGAFLRPAGTEPAKQARPTSASRMAGRDCRTYSVPARHGHGEVVETACRGRDGHWRVVH